MTVTVRPEVGEDGPRSTGMQVATSPTSSRLRYIVRYWLPPLLVSGLLIGLWYFVSYAVLAPRRRFLLPSPSEMFRDAFFVSEVRGAIFEALQRSAMVALVGLGIAFAIGVLWAIAMSQARWLERSLFPYAVFLQCIPILALVPLIGFWFGFGYTARVIVCVMISLFPIVSNTLFGLQSVDQEQRDLFKLHRANRLTVLGKLELPAALPAIFAGLRIAAGLAVVGAIVGDYFFRRGEPGLGTLISNYQARVQSAELFAAVTVASLFGVVIFLLFGWLSRRAVSRWHDFSDR